MKINTLLLDVLETQFCHWPPGKFQIVNSINRESTLLEIHGNNDNIIIMALNLVRNQVGEGIAWNA